MRNLAVGQVREAILKINLFYGIYDVQEGNYMPEVNNIYLENVTVKKGGQYGICAKGYEEKPINITLKNVTISEVDSAYTLSNVKSLHFENTYINGKKMESISNPDMN
ncbi:hypothetical protein SAMN05421636_105155 [Pricia antarctica]|uniref:Glycosyl hydrolases family 28 n=1 Tax=Pricia antarctica TaxID=641691 RepID=A0A1G7D371_9FLAO|nr:hypothetical protein [Pricia antarctica]SDE46018.1 hypothetical protein SAMN05421636_105155 [Pricia antarctica]